MTLESPPVRAQTDANYVEAQLAESALIRGRETALGCEAARRSCGGTTGQGSGGIRGRHQALGRARGGNEEGLADRCSDGAFDIPAGSDEVANVNQMTGMAWYFADLAETSAKRKRMHGEAQRPSAAERMQALRQRLAGRIAAAEASRGTSILGGAEDAGGEEERPRMTSAAAAAASAAAWHGVEQGEVVARRGLRGEPRPPGSPSKPTA